LCYKARSDNAPDGFPEKEDISWQVRAVNICSHYTRISRRISRPISTKYLALYELENDQVTSTDEWSKAANTEWMKKIRSHLKPLTNLAKRIF
jgi:hypothetical protein